MQCLIFCSSKAYTGSSSSTVRGLEDLSYEERPFSVDCGSFLSSIRPCYQISFSDRRLWVHLNSLGERMCQMEVGYLYLSTLSWEC